VVFCPSLLLLLTVVAEQMLAVAAEDQAVLAGVAAS
jgi:hypothetical protein